MEDNKKILLDLQAELEREKEIVENLEAYNKRNKLILLAAKIGLALHKSAPYIISTLLVFSYLRSSTSFFEKEKLVYADSNCIVTSSGDSHTFSSFDEVYSDSSFFHTTGWRMNPDTGLWSRTETVYGTSLPNDMELQNYEEIFELSKEEIEELVNVKDVRFIEKRYLSEEDHLYDEDAIVVKFSTDDLSDSRVEPLNAVDVIARAVLFLGLSISMGIGTRLVVKKVFKEFGLDNKVKEIELSHKIVSSEERDNIVRLLKLKERSLGILNDEEQSIEEDGSKVYSLTYRKNKR